jgi:hypothetical protein
VREVNEEWLENLPPHIISVNDSEKYRIEILTSSGNAIDDFEQLEMPWTLVATVDAYPSGTLSQKAKAVRWLEANLNYKSVQSIDTRKDWWKAEVLYSLNYAMKR